MSTVNALIKKDIRRPSAQRIVIYICELAIRFKCVVWIDHIEGKSNDFADALSRLQIDKFKRLCREQNKPIDPAPMLFQRPQVQIGTRPHPYFAPIKYRRG